MAGPTTEQQEISALELLIQRQLAHVDRDHLKDNSTHIMLCVAFIIGVADKLEIEADIPAVLQGELKFTERNTGHVIDTCRRLIKKYGHIREIYLHGQTLAGRWLKQGSTDSSTKLFEILRDNKELRLVDLEKSETVSSPTAEPAVATPSPTTAPVAARSRLWLLLVLAILLATNYFLFNYF